MADGSDRKRKVLLFFENKNCCGNEAQNVCCSFWCAARLCSKNYSQTSSAVSTGRYSVGKETRPCHKRAYPTKHRSCHSSHTKNQGKSTRKAVAELRVSRSVQRTLYNDFHLYPFKMTRTRLADFYGLILRLWTAATNGHVVHSTDNIWVCRTTVECYWQGKAEELGEKPVPVPFCPPQITHELTRERNRDSAARGRRLTAWAMARPTGTV
jgi:hypothetical protein